MPRQNNAQWDVQRIIIVTAQIKWKSRSCIQEGISLRIIFSLSLNASWFNSKAKKKIKTTFILSPHPFRQTSQACLLLCSSIIVKHLNIIYLYGKTFADLHYYFHCIYEFLFFISYLTVPKKQAHRPQIMLRIGYYRCDIKLAIILLISFFLLIQLNNLGSANNSNR